ncbi:MAG: tetratricopeptide repeat protein, partial [Chloroflexi bacterium]|nr:tetratricopeptide repeat protein [Chloroflexota bacterium]
MDENDRPELYDIWDEAKDHIESGNYDKAVEMYRYILIRYSDNDVATEHANAYLGDLFLTLRQLDLAENHIKKAIGSKPEKPAYHYVLGFVYSVKRQWDRAIPEFELAIAKEPDNGEYLRGLAWAIHSSGDRAKGLAYLHKASQLAPTNINILTDLAAAYLSAANFSKAREYAEKAVHIEPQNTLAQEVLKNVHSFEKEFKQRGKAADRVRTTGLTKSNVPRVYQFKVSLSSSPNIWRIIEIKENQMLSSLH